MKTIEVVAAIITRDHEILATQRGYGPLKGGWEFPGGKIEQGESAEMALKREILEELELQIQVGELFETVEYDYPDFHLTMHCYFCRIESGNLVLTEHEDARWLSNQELTTLDWLPADLGLIARLQSWMI